jgi:geranylgeranyl pyrophosphate synthase
VDDWLGIWGDAALTGKSIESDLVSGKKTLPVLFGLEKSEEFLIKWNKGIGDPEASQELAGMLESLGAQDFVLQQAEFHTSKALSQLDNAISDLEIHNILKKLTTDLLSRKK